jgi:CubicO group peptidase (beta-lactamase class C family)
MPIEETLTRIATDENFHGIATVSGHSSVCNIEGVSDKTPFPIHSVGKILSGVLMIEMLAQGIIEESDLTKTGIKLPPEIEEKLATKPAVMERLSQKTILQAMQHEANLGDYLDNYLTHLRDGGEVKELMTDMVDFISDNWDGKERYSNDGLLLGGFALQQLYNSKTDQNLSYEEILNKLVIEPSKTNISMTRPSDTHYGEEDHLSRFPVTPAGGHAASTDDLLKLGEYLYERCHDARFMEGVKKYGKEFYKETRNRVEHGGDMEGSTYEGRGSSVEFGVSLDDGKTTVILMDRDASEADKKEGRLRQTYARGFYHEIRGALEEEKKVQLKGNVLSALDLAVTDSQIEGLREDKDPAIKSFAEKIRPSKNKSDDNKTMAGDLMRSSSFVDRVMSEKSDSSESKVR